MKRAFRFALLLVLLATTSQSWSAMTEVPGDGGPVPLCDPRTKICK